MTPIGQLARTFFSAPLRFAPLCLLAIASSAHADWTLVRADTPVTAIHGSNVYHANAGQRLSQEDIIETSGTGVVQIQDESGNLAALGPGTRAMLTRDAHIALLNGWLKITHACASGRCATPEVETERTRFIPADRTSLVIAAMPDGFAAADAVFCESGSAHVLSLGKPRSQPADSQVDAHGSAFALHAKSTDAVAIAASPEPAFVNAMPVAFRDSLRPLSLQTTASDVPPHGSRPVSYADVADWLDSALAVRTDPATRFSERCRARLSDPAFRRDVKQHIRALPDWRALVYPPPRPAFKPFRSYSTSSAHS